MEADVAADDARLKNLVAAAQRAAKQVSLHPTLPHPISLSLPPAYPQSRVRHDAFKCRAVSCSHLPLPFTPPQVAPATAEELDAMAAAVAADDACLKDLAAAEEAAAEAAKWMPTLNTSNCPSGKGKMQKAYKHKKLSLGTWPTEGPGFELAIDAWRTFMQEFTTLQAEDVAADDARLKELVAAAQRAAAAAQRAAKQVSLHPTLPHPISLSLPPAYPQSRVRHDAFKCRAVSCSHLPLPFTPWAGAVG
jgi:hypothetical protein